MPDADLLEAARVALQYLLQCVPDRGPEWREAVAGLRTAILAAGGSLPDAREAGAEAWDRLR